MILMKVLENYQIMIKLITLVDGAGYNYISAKSTSNLIWLCMKYVYNFIDYALS